MDRLAYSAFMILDAFAIGAAVMGAYFETRLAKQSLTKIMRRGHIYAAVGKSGFALTGTILLSRVIQLGAIESTLMSWVYLIGLAVAGLGFAGATSVAADRLSFSEVTEGRFLDLESRVTHEESRNTDIEDLARSHAEGAMHEHQEKGE